MCPTRSSLRHACRKDKILAKKLQTRSDGAEVAGMALGEKARPSCVSQILTRLISGCAIIPFHRVFRLENGSVWSMIVCLESGLS